MPTLIVAPSLRFNDPAWGHFTEVLNKYLHNPDLLAVRCLYSAVAAHYLSGPQVWPLLIAPASSAKSTLLDPIQHLKHAHKTDEVTANTFISGQLSREPGKKRSAKESPSLLIRLGETPLIVISDFSTILELPSDARRKVFAQLRVIYDGQLRREFGTDEDHEHHGWKGRCTIVTATTPDGEREISGLSALGERFVTIRWPRAEGIEAGVLALRKDHEAGKRELNEGLGALFANLPNFEPICSERQTERIAALTEFVSLARTPVRRDGRQRDIDDIPAPEGNARLAIQVGQTCRGSALLDHRTEVDDADLVLGFRIALDSIPRSRFVLIQEALGAPRTQIPNSTRMRAIEDLRAVGVFTRDGAIELTEYAHSHLVKAGLLDAADLAEAV